MDIRWQGRKPASAAQIGIVSVAAGGGVVEVARRLASHLLARLSLPRSSRPLATHVATALRPHPKRPLRIGRGPGKASRGVRWQDAAMTSMSKGSNIAVSADRVRATLGWSSDADADASALLLTSATKVRSDADFVFYNQPNSPEGQVRHVGKRQVSGGTQDSIEVDLAALPDEIEKVVIAASVDGASFGEVSGLRLELTDAASGRQLARFDITDASSETAVVFGELYLRQGRWKFRAVGQGYASGLAGLATDFGISVDDASPSAPQPQSAPTPQQGTVSMKKEKQLGLEARAEAEAPHLVSLVKKAAVSLEKKGLGEHTARVALCLDISGSMAGLYRSGKIQELAERILALGLRFDDDGEVDVFLFGTRGHEAGTMNLTNFRTYIDDVLRQYHLEGSTYYGKAMRLIRRRYFGSDAHRSQAYRDALPVYVMFVTDGQTFDEDVAREQVRSSSYEPLFWEFMAIGKSSRALSGAPRSGRRGLFGGGGPRSSGGEFRLLEELDDMGGRLLDNADFFSVKDPAQISDDELFDLLMTEYPGWLSQARAKGLLPNR
jgi:stress response protein SCP2